MQQMAPLQEQGDPFKFHALFPPSQTPLPIILPPSPFRRSAARARVEQGIR